MPKKTLPILLAVRDFYVNSGFAIVFSTDATVTPIAASHSANHLGAVVPSSCISITVFH
ncbi:hypothetical protein ACQ0P5_06885 [Streptococcus canis]|uniref:hypothetical protein n=1 Tax=Streptococcus canis TaxID=1329 RepID=UPI002949C869|nr:hypothetical protein [Streptococcus canis]